MNDSVRIGKYHIETELGRGGMAVVYRAFDPSIERVVAAKIIELAQIDPAEADYVLERFKREAQAAGRLSHPNIVTVYDYGEVDGRAYIVMEYVAGLTLHQHLANGTRYGTDAVREIARQLFAALAYSHAQGVIHRDIKPSNILMGNDGQIKISDFGIARIESSNLTMDDRVLGTPNYMPPEQFRGTRVDARSDLYSCGVLLYELLTGYKPFQGSNAQIMHSVLHDLAQLPSTLKPELPAALDTVMQRALAKSPDERYASAAELGRAVESAFETEEDISNSLVNAPTIKLGAGLLASARRIGLARAGPVTPMPQAGAPLAAEQDGPKARVLFVDDEDRILNALRHLFRGRYHVFTAANGEQALAFAQRFHIHLVVSDQRMPGMLGVELLRQLRELSPTTVRILLTGYSDLAAIVGSINDGEVYRFINKPWNNRELAILIDEAVDIGLVLADAKLPSAQELQRSESAIVVVGDAELFRALRQFFGEVREVIEARDVDQALDAMHDREVSLVVLDVDDGSDDQAAAFIKLLKQERPQTLTIVTTAASDSELVISLINQAQIYRFLNHPINLKLLRKHAHSALLRYEQYRQAPELLRAHSVAALPATRESTIGQRLLARIRRLFWQPQAVARTDSVPSASSGDGTA